MLDVKMVRQNIEEVQEELMIRGVKKEILVEFTELDENRRKLLVKSEELKKYRNDVSAEIAQLKRAREDASAKVAEMKEVGGNIRALDTEIAEVDEELKQIVTTLPNFLHDSVPVGSDEEDNVETRRWSEPRTFAFEPKSHWEIAENLDTLGLERDAKVADSHFIYYKGLGARSECTIYNFMLDQHIYEHGYTEMIAPYTINSKAMFGTGQFPKFKEDAFQLENTDLTLIPTAEVPLTNYHNSEILDGADLPVYFTALSPAFRSKAGSASQDTRELIRLHQFNKAGMVKFSDTEHSYEELEKMTADAEGILKKLHLSYRVMALSAGDMGFSAARTYDLEVRILAQDTYREISFCSNCEDLQARRAMIRYRDNDGRIHYAYTLDGSGLAVGRTVAAILENYQNEDGPVAVPEALVPYMGNLKVIK